MVSIGARLAEIRKGMGLSQAAFGAIAGVRANTQLNYEAGTRSPDSVYLVALHQSGVDIGYILTGRRDTNDLTADDRALVVAYRSLNSRARATILSLVEQMADAAPLRSDLLHAPADVYRAPPSDPER